MFTNLIFENKDLRISYDKSIDEHGRVMVAARDRSSNFDYERWVIEHLSVDDVRELRDDLDKFLKKMED